MSEKSTIVTRRLHPDEAIHELLLGIAADLEGESVLRAVADAIRKAVQHAKTTTPGELRWKSLTTRA